MKSVGFASMAKREPLESFQYEMGALGPHDVLVRISHCGICHSDIHLIDDDWRMTSYPFIPGHEIVGRIEEIGSLVTHLKPGTRVGIGWQRASCLVCDNCIRGDENLCPTYTPTCVGNHGGYADTIQVDSRFAFPIPDSLDSQRAAPLLCAGITVYSPLRFFGVQPGHKVGIVGIGGLGHLALQFAKEMGCEVTAFSGTKSKKAEAESFGAMHFVVTDPTSLARAENSLDFILSTVGADIDWTAFIKILKPNGKLCYVGVPPNDIKFSPILLLSGRKSVCSSPIGGRAYMKDMLEFAARHAVAAQTEVAPLSQVNDAVTKVRKNEARYRMVLKIG